MRTFVALASSGWKSTRLGTTYTDEGAPARAARFPDNVPVTLSRREFIELVSTGALVALLPGCGDSAMPPAGPRFLTDDERAVLAAFADYILPPDDQPGGARLGTVSYTD